MSTADITTTAAAKKLIRRIEPVGSDCAEAFVRARLWGGSLAYTAHTMQLDVKYVRMCLEEADLQFLKSLEGDSKTVHRDVYREALRWTNAMETQEDTDTNWPRFAAWLSQSPQHEEAHQHVDIARGQAVKLGKELRTLGVHEDALVVAISLELARSLQRTTFRAWRPLIACAAVATFAACVIVLHGFVKDPTLESPWSYYTTDLDHRMFTLADGSELQLDAGTAVRVRFSATQRKIVLERGQILCEARHESQRTFEVFVNRIAVQALGTRFLVLRKSASEAETLVMEGAVQVLTTPAPTKIIHPGEVALIDTGLVRVDQLSPADIGRRLAWMHGWVTLQGTLEEVVEIFNRYNRQQLIIDDPDIRRVQVAGLYDSHNPERFAAELWILHHIKHARLASPDSGEIDIHLQSTP